MTAHAGIGESPWGDVIALSSDGSTLYVGTQNDGNILTFDAATLAAGTPIATGATGAPPTINALAAVPNRTLYAGASDGNVYEIIDTYTLTYTAGAHGSITGTSPQTVDYGTDGSRVTAVPDSGYHFTGWSDSVATASRQDKDVTADVTVTANFSNTYTLTYTAGAHGSITGTSPQTVVTGTDGDTVTATPDPGYHFTGWSDSVATASRQDKDVTADVTVTANFAINTYTLTYTAGAHGSITGTSPQTVNYGADGSAVTAVPATGYHFTGWSDSVATASRQDMAVTGNVTVTANFAINTYTLTYTAGAHGSITGTSPQTVNYGADGSAVTAVPATGYHFTGWSDSVATASRQDMAVTGNVTVTATFAINTYTLTYTAGAHGTITGTSPQTVNYGADGTMVTATPATGYHFVDWSDGVLTAAAPTRT